MADQNFRPRKNPAEQTPEQSNEALERINQMRKQSRPDDEDNATNQDFNPAETAVPPQALPPGTFPIQGNVPPAFQAALAAARGGGQDKIQQNFSGNEPKRGFNMSRGGEAETPQAAQQQRANLSSTGSAHLKELLENLRGSTATYEEIQLPSKGRF